MSRASDKRALSTRGYFGVVAWYPKNSDNVGTLWRSATVFGAAFLATVGRRYQKQHSDTTCSGRHIPIFHFVSEQDLWDHVPDDCQPVGVELVDWARPLKSFTHPRSALYLLGPEDGSLPERVLSECVSVVRIPGKFCLNLAVAGSIVICDRTMKRMEGE